MESRTFEDLKRLVLFVAINYHYYDTVAKFLPNTSLKARFVEANSNRAFSTDGQASIELPSRKRSLREYSSKPDQLSLFSWAVQCGNYLLVRALLDQEPLPDCYHIIHIPGDLSFFPSD